MKPKVQFITGAITAVVGLLLLIFSNKIASADVVMTGGILFIVAAVLDIVVSLGEKGQDGKRRAGSFLVTFNWIVSIAAIILGVCMIFIKDAFVPFVPYVFGLISLFGALMLFYVLAIGVRPVMLSGWLYLLPVVVLVLAVVTFLRDSATQDSQIMILTGVSALLFGAASFFVGAGIARHEHKAKKEAEAESAAKADETKEPVALDEHKDA